jgi:hypothetical protein
MNYVQAGRITETSVDVDILDFKEMRFQEFTHGLRDGYSDSLISFN